MDCAFGACLSYSPCRWDKNSTRRRRGLFWLAVGRGFNPYSWLQARAARQRGMAAGKQRDEGRKKGHPGHSPTDPPTPTRLCLPVSHLAINYSAMSIIHCEYHAAMTNHFLNYERARQLWAHETTHNSAISKKLLPNPKSSTFPLTVPQEFYSFTYYT